MAFNWEQFDKDTLTGIAMDLGFEPSRGEEPSAFLAKVAPQPSPDLVKETKGVLERLWLPRYEGVDSIVSRLRDAGIGPMWHPDSNDECVDYIERCRNTKTIQELICEAMLRFGDGDPDAPRDLDVDFVPRFAVIEPSAQEPDGRSPYLHQQEAWDALNQAYAQSESTGSFRGMLVMPTGSGKTYTAVRWLLERAVSRGIRVLWIAHRHELLVQAARQFHQLAAFARGRDEIRVRVVSGAHSPAASISPDDDVIVCSVQSLARRSDVRDSLAGENEPFVVIDEAHHSTAKSYRDLIELFGEDDKIRLMGLTATPTRTLEDERPILSRMYGLQVLSQVSYQELIGRGILAQPHPVRVQTDARPEEGVTEEEIKHLFQFRDLGESWLDRIAKLTDRNQVIVQHYLENRDRYGKTLVFAINVKHAVLLTELLREHGISAEYVASYRPDGTEGSPPAVIERFRNDEFDVLVNVQIATEGVDVPDVQSVFLTRPTQSEILFRQMIGRGLRGPRSGGTDIAYLVSFEDHWERFVEWMDPFSLIEGFGSVGAEGESESGEVEAAPIPWDIYRQVTRRFLEIREPLSASAFDAIPHGWYLLESDAGVDDDPLIHHVLVYEHQRPCWEAFFDVLYANDPPALNGDPFDDILDDWFEEWFGDCDVPTVNRNEVGIAIMNRCMGGDRPEYQSVEERKQCDPAEIAKIILKRDLGERARSELVEERFSEMARMIYPRLNAYRAAVDDALRRLKDPDDPQRRLGVPIFGPRPDVGLAEGPAHDLERLLKNTLQRAPWFSQFGEAPSIDGISISWSRRVIKGWFATARWEPGTPLGTGEIVVNRLLDSPDVPDDVIEFLLWHEFLHLYLQAGHTKRFRKLERRWPTAVEGDRFLKTINEKWNVGYW